MKVPLTPWPAAEGPWRRIHIDFGEPTKGQLFVVVSDSFSKLLDAQWLSPATSATVVSYLRRLFRMFGPPDTLVSDNGTQFRSSDFAKFCAEFNVVHLRCAPRCPMSNGQAEKMVRYVKDAIDSTSRSLDHIVTAYNSTPASALVGKSPNEVFFGRCLKTPFDFFKPKCSSAATFTAYQEEFKQQFDRHHGTAERPFERRGK